MLHLLSGPLGRFETLRYAMLRCVSYHKRMPLSMWQNATLAKLACEACLQASKAASKALQAACASMLASKTCKHACMRSLQESYPQAVTFLTPNKINSLATPWEFQPCFRSIFSWFVNEINVLWYFLQFPCVKTWPKNQMAKHDGYILYYIRYICISLYTRLYLYTFMCMFFDSVEM